MFGSKFVSESMGALSFMPKECRPGRIGALEKSIRGFAERDEDEVIKLELGTTASNGFSWNLSG